MPRGPRLDAPGTLHHVIVRGIEKRRIVDDNWDRKNFTSRLGSVAIDTDTLIYAWALLNNHAHILLRSGAAGLPTFMRRLLTGYAISYNKRHKRHGHLFQNRYKSIICEEDIYFKELVRYIHLNPIRAGIVESISKLDRYKWCGHSTIMGHSKCDWQDRGFVLSWFGKKETLAKKKYREFVFEGIALGKRTDLTGGGLVRSMGGWSGVIANRASGFREESDARILGSGNFVSQVIKHANENIKYQLPKVNQKRKIEKEIERQCKKQNISVNLLRSGSRRPPLPELRRTIALKLVNKHGMSLADSARYLGITTSGVAQILKRNSAD